MNIDFTFSNEKSKKEYPMYYIINANSEILNSELCYYYPRGTLELEKYVIKPQSDYFLEFYKQNVQAYEEICKHVKIVIAFNGEFTSYKAQTCNHVTLTCAGNESSCYLTCFSLLKIPNVKFDQDLEKIEIFLVTNVSQLMHFFKQVDYMVSIKSIWEKTKFIKQLQEDYQMEKLELDKASMKNRVEFLKRIESTNADYLFRDPKTDQIVMSGLDILLLQKPAVTTADINSQGIVINLDDINNKTSQSLDEHRNEITYVTYHIPKEDSSNVCKVPKKVKYLLKFVENNQLEHYINHDKFMVNYDSIRDQDFITNCCLFYERSINFGSIDDSYTCGLRIGSYSFNSMSAGTLLFDLSFKPVGIAFAGCFDFYPGIKRKNLYNIFLPLNHIGAIYFFKKWLSPNSISLQDFLEENKVKAEVYGNEKEKEKVQEVIDQGNLSMQINANMNTTTVQKNPLPSKEENSTTEFQMIKKKRGRPPKKPSENYEVKEKKKKNANDVKFFEEEKNQDSTDHSMLHKELQLDKIEVSKSKLNANTLEKLKEDKEYIPKNSISESNSEYKEVF